MSMTNNCTDNRIKIMYTFKYPEIFNYKYDTFSN